METIYKGKTIDLKNIADKISANMIKNNQQSIDVDDLRVLISSELMEVEIISDSFIIDTIVELMNDELCVNFYYYVQPEKSFNINDIIDFVFNSGNEVCLIFLNENFQFKFNQFSRQINESFHGLNLKDKSTYSYLDEFQQTDLFEQINVFLKENYDSQKTEAYDILNKDKQKYFSKLSDGKITDEMITDLVMNVLDEDTILLANGIATGSFSTKYDIKFRYVVLNHLKNNKTGKLAQLLLSSFINESIKSKNKTLKELTNYFEFKELKKIHENSSPIHILKSKINEMFLVKGFQNNYTITKIKKF